MAVVGQTIKVGSAEWYLTWFRNHYEKLYDTTERKNSDYSTGGNLQACAFDNFEHLAKITHGKLNTIHGFLFRLSDKWTRMLNLITNDNGPRVTTEPVEDTIDDMIIYLMLLRAYMEFSGYEESNPELTGEACLQDPRANSGRG